MQYKYTLFHKVVYKLVVSTRFLSDVLCLNCKKCWVQNKNTGHITVIGMVCAEKSIVIIPEATC